MIRERSRTHLPLRPLRPQNAQAEIAPGRVLLATAWVDLCTPEGRCFKVRALLDQGSTVSFISESLCQTLRTKRQRAAPIRYFGDNYIGRARSKVSFRLGPCAKSGTTFSFTAYVFQRITTYADSVSPLLAISARSRAGGSEPVQFPCAHNSRHRSSLRDDEWRKKYVT